MVAGSGWPLDRVTRAKIDSLLYEVRSGTTAGNGAKPPGPWDPEALARRYQLDPMIVRALLETERVPLVDVPSEDEADPNGSTQVMSIDELGVG